MSHSEEEYRLVIGNLFPSISDGELKVAFEKFGHLVAAKVFKDKWTGKCTGFGVVVFDKQPPMEAAVQEMDHTILGGRYISVAKARPSFGRPREILPEGVYYVRFFGVGGGGFGEDCFKCGKPGHLAQECGKKVSSSSRYGGRVDSVKPRYLTDERRIGERYSSSGRRDRSRSAGGSQRGSPPCTRHHPSPYDPR